MPGMDASVSLSVAVTTFGDRISARLDCAETMQLLTVRGGAVVERHELAVPATGKREILEKLGVDVLLCGGLTAYCVNLFRGSRIRVIPWLQGNVEEVLARFLRGDYDAVLAQPDAHPLP